MFRPIGEVFEDKGVKLKVVESDCFCGGCYFLNKGLCKNSFKNVDPAKNLGSCCKAGRDDNTDVIFKGV